MPPKFACLTFDDGPDYDWIDLLHPVHGLQTSMYSILRRHSVHAIGRYWFRRISATSFVIASPVARREISSSASDNPDRMSDTWWAQAQVSGLLDIGSHGWNHVHPAVSELRTRPELVEAFHAINRIEDVQLQMKSSFEFIRDKAGGDSARLFAYPYGQASNVVTDEYLPRQSDYLAAFTTEGRPLRDDCDLWRLPRYVCGWHWKSNDELCKLLAEG